MSAQRYEIEAWLGDVLTEWSSDQVSALHNAVNAGEDILVAFERIDND